MAASSSGRRRSGSDSVAEAGGQSRGSGGGFVGLFAGNGEGTASLARAVLHVVGNRDWALNSGVSIIEKLARRTLPSTGAAQRARAEPYQSPWERVPAEALEQAGVEVVPQYPIAGRFRDLGILNPRKIDVAVDGESVHRTAGRGRKDDDHRRDLQLQSLGWQACRFWVYQLRGDLPAASARYRSFWKNRVPLAARNQARPDEGTLTVEAGGECPHGEGWLCVFSLRSMGAARRLMAPDSLAIVFAPNAGVTRPVSASEAMALVHLAESGAASAHPPDGEVVTQARRVAQELLRVHMPNRDPAARTVAGMSLVLLAAVK